MRLTNLLLAASAAMGLTACATGSGEDRGPETVRALLSADVMMFVSFDTDGDLQITRAEIDAGIAREFARADTNRDGQLQPIEFQNWANAVLGGGQMGPYRLDFDRNVDNIITREEFEREINARASDYDSDENGSLSRSEFVRLVGQPRAPHRQNPMQPTPSGSS